MSGRRAEVREPFAHAWRAEILKARPLILPPRHFTYPREAEEVERGALEVLVTPEGSQPFLATCAVGFADPIVPTGVWSAPNPRELCAVSGGYAYVIDTTDPERFAMIAYRPVLEVRPVEAEGLLLFIGHRSIVAWGQAGRAWESPKLSDEGLTIAAIEGGVLHGMGWEMRTDKETAFAIDLGTGEAIGS
ncbi:hypothetical protein DYQ86_14780 [Acidobacteria bacterium AB60]|nr:hypothetical protein DYQ86_14780 [Acidobacteria bacterium AB60]